nr:2427_t:CDS:2 [Entrophospora candida]CAG8548868.1 13667_t:CDS:2 [Entrophospora candida]
MKLLLLLKIFVVTIDAAASILGKNDNIAQNLNITPIRILATTKVPTEVNPSLITKTSTAYTEATPNNNNSLLYIKNKQDRIPTPNKTNASETVTVTTTETLLAPPTITQFASCQQPNSINTSTMMYNPAECSQRNSLPDGEICENNDQCLSGNCRLVQINGIKKCQNAVTIFSLFRKKKPTTSITLEHNDKKLTVDIEDDDNESLILEDLLPEPPNRAYFSATADDLIWGNGNRASNVAHSESDLNMNMSCSSSSLTHSSLSSSYSSINQNNKSSSLSSSSPLLPPNSSR